MVTVLTMTYVDEAIGVAQAAAAAGVPSAIAFTVETDGRLPDGTRSPMLLTPWTRLVTAHLRTTW